MLSHYVRSALSFDHSLFPSTETLYPPIRRPVCVQSVSSLCSSLCSGCVQSVSSRCPVCVQFAFSLCQVCVQLVSSLCSVCVEFAHSARNPPLPPRLHPHHHTWLCCTFSTAARTYGLTKSMHCAVCSRMPSSRALMAMSESSCSEDVSLMDDDSSTVKRLSARVDSAVTSSRSSFRKMGCCARVGVREE